MRKRFLFGLLGLVSLWEIRLCSFPSGNVPQALGDSAWKGGQIEVGTISKAPAAIYPLSELDNTLQKGKGSILIDSSKPDTLRAPKNLREHPRESSSDEQYHMKKKKPADEFGGFDPGLRDNTDSHRQRRLAESSGPPTIGMHDTTKTLISPTFRNEPDRLEISRSVSFLSPQSHLSPENLDFTHNSNAPLEHPLILPKKPKNYPPQALAHILSPYGNEYLTDRDTDLFYAYLSLLSKETRKSKVKGAFSSPLNKQVLFNRKPSEGDYSSLNKKLTCLKDLRNTMLRVHFNLVQGISPEVEKEALRCEQNGLEDVFSKFFSSREMTLVVLNADTLLKSQETQKLDRFQNLVAEYMTASHVEAWVVNNSFSQGQTFSISRSLRLKTEIALSFIKSYYQSANWDKWKALFKDDDLSFLKFMVNLAQLFKNNNQYKKDYSFVEELNQCSTLIPWSDPLTLDQKALLKELKNLWPEKYFQKAWLESSVIPAFKKDIFLLQESTDYIFQKQAFHVSQLGPRIYEFFHILYRETLLAEEKREIENAVKESINFFLLMYFRQIQPSEDAFISIPLEEVKNFVQEKDKKFVEVLWFMNLKFLEIFGCESSHPAYHMEQQLVQQWAWENKLIEDLRRKLGTTHTLNSSIQNVNPVDERSFHEADAMMGFLNEKELRLIESREIVKEVIQLLCHYYETTNKSKFKAFYDQDEDYVKSLLVYAEYWGSEASRNLKLFGNFILKEFKVLPWQDEIKTFEDIKKVQGSASLKLFKRCYSYQSSF
ncbi:hypothetical protein O181_036375 [Austropuccinia psidii MF-1]|uniref:Uncharacterized protein n=1 Tax=Austropuccinia psidii MF-1 TaxID=1389203 RepID=A0A9Q3HC48_9BASI|nr:hypothetical protein [Austropuccinia psidii MF-1]